jgi:alpha-L-fucosidase
MKRQGGISHRRMTGTVLAVVLLAGAVFGPVMAETEAEREARMKWWTEARFGMFIHWGLYALPARHEWVRNHERIRDVDYQKYFDHFNPDLYDPAAWARAAKNAGMKYFVVTTKHHEGFCLFDSKYTDYKATKTPYGKDLIRPLLEAMRAEGLKVGFYYSLLDWHHPEYTLDENHPMWGDKAFAAGAAGRDQKKYVTYLHDQVRELLTEYGRIDCLFMDFSFPGPNGKGRKDWESERLLRMVRELQPGIIVDDRLDLLDVAGGWDYRTPEQFMPAEWITVDGKRVPWETCQTFSGSWGYHRDEATWKSVRQLVVMLIETVSKGGNLLLNVGPTARGTLDGRAMTRLDGIGAWMKLHGRSIYGCTQARDGFKGPANTLLTYAPASNRLYVHVLEWPMGVLSLKGFAGLVSYAQLLNDGSEIRFTEDREAGFLPGTREGRAGGALVLDLPVVKPDVEVPVIELFLK